MNVFCRLMLGILFVTFLPACAKQVPLKGTALDEKARFHVSEQGLVTDTQMGLMWAPAPDRDVNWEQAEEYVKSLKLGGYTDWRLPTLSELKSLYQQERALTALHFSRWAWSSEVTGSSASLFNFDHGVEFIDDLVDSRTNRVLPVRVQK